MPDFSLRSSPGVQMMKFLQTIFIISGILIFLLLFASGLIFYLASNSLPDYEQKLNSPEITEKLTISRDSYAIPYIEARNNKDGFFALGYAHAQDRLWQMILLRRIAQGRLSEILGSEAFESDILMRSLSIYENAQKSVNYQTETISSLLDAYSSGINKYIRQISELGLGRGGPEFFFFTSKISPWQPADSIALIKLIAFLSTDKANLEILRTKFALEKIHPQRINDLFGEPPLINRQENQTISYLMKNKYKPTNKPRGYKFSKNIFKYPMNTQLNSSLGASNIFAVMPFRSATGATLAASDPHSTLTAPSNFMLVSLRVLDHTVIGGTIPGIPAILIGRTDNLGWGISNANIDDQDLFIEKLNPDNQLEYFTEKGTAQIKAKSEIIRIKDKKSVKIEVKSTRNGPILPFNVLGIRAIRPKGHEISINWTGLSNTDRSIEALISIMLSKSIAEAKQKLHLLEAPGQNVMIVDKESIAIFTAGAIPARSENHATRGKIPSLAWVESNIWAGKLPFEKNPKIQNPKSGIIVNTNNRTTNAKFPYHVSYDWGDSQRIIRASNLLRKREFHTVNSFKEIQTDTISVSARILLPLIAKNLWFGPETNPGVELSSSELEVLKILSEWNGDMNQNDSAPLIYVSWIGEFQRMIMLDDLGELYKNIPDIQPLFLERVLRNRNGAAKWCDIVQTPKKETCDEIARRALTVSVKKLKNNFGTNVRSWRWGEAHIAIHKPQIIGSWPFLSFFTNIVHEISGGDNTMMMSRILNSQKNQFIASHGSTLRTIYDFSQTNHVLFIISTGQSGHFLSKHYSDQSILWQQEQYIPMKYNKRNLNGKIATITFDPIVK